MLANKQLSLFFVFLCGLWSSSNSMNFFSKSPQSKIQHLGQFAVRVASNKYDCATLGGIASFMGTTVPIIALNCIKQDLTYKIPGSEQLPKDESFVKLTTAKRLFELIKGSLYAIGGTYGLSVALPFAMKNRTSSKLRTAFGVGSALLAANLSSWGGIHIASSLTGIESENLWNLLIDHGCWHLGIK